MRRVLCTKATRRWQDFMPSPTHPFFPMTSSFFGNEIVGGPLLSVLEGSRQTAAVAIRILGGEKAGDIKVPPIGFAAPKFDWRQMQRWGISESLLPAKSEVRFREPTVWDQYQSADCPDRDGTAPASRAHRRAAVRKSPPSPCRSERQQAAVRSGAYESRGHRRRADGFDCSRDQATVGGHRYARRRGSELAEEQDPRSRRSAACPCRGSSAKVIALMQ